MNAKQAILGLSLTYLVGAFGGCASTGALEQQKRAAELDALLDVTISETAVLRPVETVKPIAPSYVAPVSTPARPVVRAPHQEIDISQYLITPEERAAQVKAEAEEVKKIQAEGLAEIDRRYQTCKDELRYQLPPNARGECHGKDGDKYMSCNFTIDGCVYEIRIEAERVAKVGPEVAYQQLVASKPDLLETLAKKHCVIEEKTLEFEGEEVLGQSVLEYAIHKG